eukprot:TRINITY_DN40968_c0_g2_i1.p1 TRINITY_DN40968_c0_g2~~TRINITY_DN40968_c0_g2_i1.p1  ORF type:complete len:104 (+),score=12.08 TRINITY_DN40968_c0_g2_i1:99-410(+)
MSSLLTGAKGRKAAVRVRKTSVVIEMGTVRGRAGGPLEMGGHSSQPPTQQRAQQRLQREAHRDHGDDQREQEQHVEHQQRLALQIGRAVQQECRDRSRMPSSA